MGSLVVAPRLGIAALQAGDVAKLVVAEGRKIAIPGALDRSIRAMGIVAGFGVLPARGAGEFMRAALFIAANATDVVGEMLEKNVPPGAPFCLGSRLEFV